MNGDMEGGPSENIFPITEKWTVVSPLKKAEGVRRIIMEMNLFDPERSTGRNGKVHFPVIFENNSERTEFMKRAYESCAEVSLIEGVGLTVPRDKFMTPKERVMDILRDQMDSEKIELIPWKYERIGDCCVLRLPQELKEHHSTIAGAFKEVLNSRYVLNDASGISGEFRVPSMDVLIRAPDGNYEVIHREGNARFILDPRKVMFSSGNVDERTEFPERADKWIPPRIRSHKGDATSREVVIDMFSGIGYFSIPLAISQGVPRRIYSVEKNPVSYGYLKRNITLNRVDDIVIPVLGDNRGVPEKVKADRLIMGYVGGTIDFIPRAMELMRPEGAVVHFHDTIETEVGIEGCFKMISSMLDDEWRIILLTSRKIKSYAPRIDHVVVDLEFLPNNG